MSKNNRLAVLLVGDLRLWKRAAPYIFEFAEGLSNSVDYYFATWSKTRDYWWPEEKSINSIRDVTEREISEPFGDRNLIDIKIIDQAKAIPRQHLTIYYQSFLAKLANLAKNRYEFENGFVYDNVIEIRPDLYVSYERLLQPEDRLPGEFEYIAGPEYINNTFPYPQINDFYSRSSSFGNDVIANRFFRQCFMYSGKLNPNHTPSGPNNHWVLLDYLYARRMSGRAFGHYETDGQIPIRPNFPECDLNNVSLDDIKEWDMEWIKWQWS